MSYHEQTLEPRSADMPATDSPPEPRVLLEGIRWATYEAIHADLGDGPIRLTYDGGQLEIVSPSSLHDWVRTLLGTMISMMTVELDVPIRSGGSLTWKRRDLQKGLEPDACYWVQNEPLIRGRDDLTIGVDPPPDLAIEVEVSQSSLDKLGVYAGLGVPEVWRWRDDRITVHVLGADGRYVESRTSPAFPWLPVVEFAGFLARRNESDETTWLRRFRDWVRRALDVT